MENSSKVIFSANPLSQSSALFEEIEVIHSTKCESFYNRQNIE